MTDEHNSVHLPKIAVCNGHSPAGIEVSLDDTAFFHGLDIKNPAESWFVHIL